MCSAAADHPAITLADAVVALLNDEHPVGGWSQSFTAERRYLPQLDLTKLGPEIYISCLPASAAPDGRDTRGQFVREIGIKIVVQRKVTTDSNDELDAMVAFVDQVQTFLQITPPTTDLLVQFVRIEPDSQLYYSGDLREKSVFGSDFTATFQVRRAR